MTPLILIIIAAMLMTLAVLLLGLGSMAHGGKFDEEHRRSS